MRAKTFAKIHGLKALDQCYKSTNTPEEYKFFVYYSDGGVEFLKNHPKEKRLEGKPDVISMKETKEILDAYLAVQRNGGISGVIHKASKLEALKGHRPLNKNESRRLSNYNYLERMYYSCKEHQPPK